MKNTLITCLFLLTFYQGFTQYNPPISRSRFYNNKYSTFATKPGDILLYTVNKDSQNYNVIVTVKKFDSEINFDFARPANLSVSSINYTGNINVSAEELNDGIKYGSVFDSSTKISKKGSFFWLSKKNYIELVEDRITTMDVGSGQENFVRKNTSTLKINYKGKEKIITVYKIENTNVEKRKEMTVLTDERNPLILSMDVGWTMTLKEVR